MIQSVLTPMTNRKSSGCGCLGGGCAMGIVIALILGGALFWGAWSTFSGIRSMTATELRPLPSHSATEADIRAVAAKAEAFSTTFASGAEAEIQLTATELNTLINYYEPWSGIRGKAHITIEGNRIFARTSIPLTQIRALQDRWFNGDISMSFVTIDGKPGPENISVKAGQVEMPRWALRYISSKNFVESLGVPDLSETSSIGSNLTALEVRDGQLIVRAKKGK